MAIEGKKMTRREAIDNAIVGLSSEYMLCINKRQYLGLYEHKIGKPLDAEARDWGDYIEATFENWPTWEELVFSQRPYLATEEAYAEWTKPPKPMTDEDRARIQAERDKYPTMSSAYVPFGSKHKLMIPAWKYTDGRTSTAMMTNPEWLELPEEKREKLSVPLDNL